MFKFNNKDTRTTPEWVRVRYGWVRYHEQDISYVHFYFPQMTFEMMNETHLELQNFAEIYTHG